MFKNIESTSNITLCQTNFVSLSFIVVSFIYILPQNMFEFFSRDQKINILPASELDNPKKKHFFVYYSKTNITTFNIYTYMYHNIYTFGEQCKQDK